MKSKLYKERNLRLFAKYNEIRTKVVRGLLEDTTLKRRTRYNLSFYLTQKPKYLSFVKSHNRCLVTGRSRGVFRLTKTSRLFFRKLGTQGLLPGVRLSNW